MPLQTISEKITAFIKDCEVSLQSVYARIEETEFATESRVLEAFQHNGVSQRHFAPTTGYGYDDVGRDTLDRVFAEALECEDALVRPQIVSGTHAAYLVLSALLMPGDTLLSVCGKPYDTLEKAIGIAGHEPSALSAFGVRYKQIELDAAGHIDKKTLETTLDDSVKIAYIQRSRGYAWRDSLLPADMKDVITLIHKTAPKAIVVVDNCYGEFTQAHEPSYYGADVLFGSLIKNAGGGLAPTGGYIGGRAKWINLVAQRLTVPGMGREVGSYAGGYQLFFQGLFLAPGVTASAVKTAALFAKAFEKLGFEIMPGVNAIRSDIVQAIKLNTGDALKAFCRAVQASAPVDSMAVPEPWDMPGYTHQVIMAAGAFNQGASIELSADGPMKEPYIVYVQGALNYMHGRIAVTKTVDAMIQAGYAHV